MADEQRIAVLEQHVRELYEQIGALREELRTGARTGLPERVPRAAPARRAAVPAGVRCPAHEEAPAPTATARHPARRAPRHSARGSPDIDLSRNSLAATAPSPSHRSRSSWASGPFFPGRSSTDSRTDRSRSTRIRWRGNRCRCGSLGAREPGRAVRQRSPRAALAIVHVDPGPPVRICRCSARSPRSLSPRRLGALAALALTSEERTLFAIGFAGAHARAVRHRARARIQSSCSSPTAGW